MLVFSLLLLLLILPSYTSASNYEYKYSFYSQYRYYRTQDGHTLTVSVTPSLYDYYSNATHNLAGDTDYSKFVTPTAVKPIADNIQNVTQNEHNSEEEFANSVLMLVHQLTYVESNVKYPVETIADNSGDCDTLSLLAASIMKAGGLDVVLLYYKDLSHMNVGVYLPYTPHHRLLSPATCYEYNGKEYWVAECTPGGQWQVGDQPESIAGAKPVVIPLEDCEQSSPSSVSSSLDSPLIPSSISIDLSSDPSSISDTARILTISGSISPAYSGQNVVMYVSQDGTSYNAIKTQTDSTGNYSFAWNFTAIGTYYITASWSGTSNYASADSETLTVFVGFYQPLIESQVPEYLWGTGPDYVWTRANSATYQIAVSQGVKQFLKVDLSGTNVSLSGQFIVLKSGQTVTMPESETITIPASEQIIRFGRQRITITREEQTITLPAFNQTVAYQLGFILQNNGGSNYTVAVKGLDDSDVSQLVNDGGNATAFMNVSTSITENTWYNVVATMSGNGINAELHDANGTLLKSVVTKGDAASLSEFGILMAYNTDTVVAFKNLKVETLNPPTQPLGNNDNAANELELLAPFIGLAILPAVAFAAIAYITKKRKGQRPTA
jgi:hypothetical protein